MKKVCPWCGQPLHQGQLKHRIDVGSVDRSVCCSCTVVSTVYLLAEASADSWKK